MLSAEEGRDKTLDSLPLQVRASEPEEPAGVEAHAVDFEPVRAEAQPDVQLLLTGPVQKLSFPQPLVTQHCLCSCEVSPYLREVAHKKLRALREPGANRFELFGDLGVGSDDLRAHLLDLFELDFGLPQIEIEAEVVGGSPVQEGLEAEEGPPLLLVRKQQPPCYPPKARCQSLFCPFEQDSPQPLEAAKPCPCCGQPLCRNQQSSSLRVNLRTQQSLQKAIAFLEKGQGYTGDSLLSRRLAFIWIY